MPAFGQPLYRSSFAHTFALYVNRTINWNLNRFFVTPASQQNCITRTVQRSAQEGDSFSMFRMGTRCRHRGDQKYGDAAD
ncbi:unnamed protein product [Rangifer tarandus platyrhynchus]|uniref:Uncharacterized protein n=1 Tax=Rangifer tarandus platyrhynchus TaxID=3082113 RepID=A0ABN8XJZ0_RANTA|nr:unnamed protein product [Rangifer tarandus platyrhynchus]